MTLIHRCRRCTSLCQIRAAPFQSRSIESVVGDNRSSRLAKPMSELPGPPDTVMKSKLLIPFYFLSLVLNSAFSGKRYDFRNPQTFSLIMKESYGDIYRFMSNLDGSMNNIVVVAHPDYARAVLQAPQEEHKRIHLDLSDICYKRNNLKVKPISMLSGKEWEERRKPTQEKMLRPAIVASYVPLIEKVTNDFVEKLREKRTSEDILSDLSDYATESVGYLCFNKRLGCLEKSDNPVATHTRRVFDMLGQTFIRQDKSYLKERTPFYNEFEHHFLEFNKIVSKELKEQKRFLKRLEDEGNLEEYLKTEPNFMYSLLSDPRVSEEEANKMVTDLFMAGIETTSNSICLVLIDLCLHQDKQQKLYDEIQQVVGESKTLTKEHLAQMSYLKACFKETMRLHYPLLGGPARYLESDLEVGGYLLPKGTFVSTSGPSMCADGRFFPSPSDYLPERWLRETDDELATGRKYPFALKPFGFGRRSCLGQRFAETEIYIAITKILQNFRVSLPDGVKEVKTKVLLFRSPVKKVTVSFKERKHF